MVDQQQRSLLRRAANLLTSNGQPVPALQDIVPAHETSEKLYSGLFRARSWSDNGFGVSIKKQLTKVKTGPIVRSKSSRSNNGSLLKWQGARSDVFLATSGIDKLNTSEQPPHGHAMFPCHTSNPPTSSPNQDTGNASNPSDEQIEPLRKKACTVEVTIPLPLQEGVPMMKVSANKQKSYCFRLDPDRGQILWESQKPKIIPIEAIKELRSSVDARYYRQQFQLAQEYEERWLTIIYMLEGRYKTLHLIASTKDVFQMWDITLRKLFTIRQELMSGLGNLEARQALWERQCWKGADEQGSHKLEFDEVEKLCKRLNIHSSNEDLLRLFRQADIHRRGYLDFGDFQKFVKLLKARPELDRLYKKLCSSNGGVFNFRTFEMFMRGTQKSKLSGQELQHTFLKYSSLSKRSSSDSASAAISSTSSTSTEIYESNTTPPPLATSPASPISMSPSVDDNQAPLSFLASQDDHMTLDGFAAFLLSGDNSAFADQHGRVWHDMTKPLPEYYISSSHNTYLVGHQLVGASTIEGYIRALLHGCRSVELDIYDGDNEPMIFHGKTFTSKVPLREVCQAIIKYAFVTSPYPIIISAEIHCSVSQQDMIVNIMDKIFGDALVSTTIDGRPRFNALPSPEDLKGRILLKAKNLYHLEDGSVKPKEVTVDAESSSTETSESEIVHEIKLERQKAREREVDAVQELKEEFHKVRNVIFGRGRGEHKSSSALVIPTITSAAAPLEQSKSVPNPHNPKRKVKMSLAIVALLVYTVGVKCRGINKKEHYAPEHVFSLSERTSNKILKQGMADLIKHNKSHLVRIYPKGLRLNSTNYDPHRYWSAGAQLVAINWQTFDVGYTINHAMFQRNGRSGYVLKPAALRLPDKELLAKRTKHCLELTMISAQQLPRPKNSSGWDVIDRSVVNPYVEVSVHIPDWSHSPLGVHTGSSSSLLGMSTSTTGSSSTAASTLTFRTSVVKSNGFNPVWEETLSIPFECVGDMRDLIFVRFSVRSEGDSEEESIAVYCVSLGSLEMGYRHIPLHDAQLSQYLFSTLFVRVAIHDI